MFHNSPCEPPWWSDINLIRFTLSSHTGEQVEEAQTNPAATARCEIQQSATNELDGRPTAPPRPIVARQTPRRSRRCQQSPLAGLGSVEWGSARRRNHRP